MRLNARRSAVKLYDAEWAPSPRRVRIFLAEKGISVERQIVNLREGEHLREGYRAINPRGVVPALVLDSGEVICESAAICRYFEAVQPEPALFGTDPVSIGRIESWTRLIEGNGYTAVVDSLRNTRPVFAGRPLPGAWPDMPQLPELAERAAVMWLEFVEMFDARLGDSEWVASDSYSYADITALVTVDFAKATRLVMPKGYNNITRWHDAASARRSAGA
jgi:glutathione S-transferase